jgi:ribose transport system ATP-binding protein
MAMPLLDLEEVSKTFPGNAALKAVSFSVLAGEVHALMGENGAGKSTLVKVIAGEHDRTSGKIRINGEEISGRLDAVKHGIGLVHQELSLVPALSITENIYLGRLPRRLGSIDWRKAKERARLAMSRLGVEVDPGTPVRQLEVAEQQLVEIARVLERAPKLILFDEPTSALSDSEKTRLFDIIRRLKAEGHGIVYISHNIRETLQIGDRITVLRDGVAVAMLEAKDASDEKIVGLMIGKGVADRYPKTQVPIGEAVMQVVDLTMGRSLKNVSFSLCRGEILGVYGLMGAGQADLPRVIFGLSPLDGGEILVGSKRLAAHDASQAIAAGIGLLSRDRRNSLIPMQPIAPNLGLPWLFDRSLLAQLDRPRERRESADYIRMMHIRPPSTRLNLLHYSGGNQQKVLLARWMSTGSRILILDEPTRGIDVAAKAEVFEIIGKLVKEGAAVLMISSEISEIVALADRALVMHSGSIKTELPRDALSEESLLLHAS